MLVWTRVRGIVRKGMLCTKHACICIREHEAIIHGKHIFHLSYRTISLLRLRPKNRVQRLLILRKSYPYVPTFYQKLNTRGHLSAIFPEHQGYTRQASYGTCCSL